jgi:hypothetical protein
MVHCVANIFDEDLLLLHDFVPTNLFFFFFFFFFVALAIALAMRRKSFLFHCSCVLK